MSVTQSMQQICDDYLADWDSGLVPDMEWHLHHAPPHVRNDLLNILIPIDIQNRTTIGEQVTPQAYAHLGSHAAWKANQILTMPDPLERRQSHWRIGKVLIGVAVLSTIAAIAAHATQTNAIERFSTAIACCTFIFSIPLLAAGKGSAKPGEEGDQLRELITTYIGLESIDYGYESD